MRLFASFARRLAMIAMMMFFAIWNVPMVHASNDAIDAFDAQFAIQANGSVKVTERIQYVFDAETEHHGIFRDIPLTSENGPRLVIRIVGVTDETGARYRYTTSTKNDVLDVKIGDANVLVSGEKTYVLNYTVSNAIRSFDDHDEFYWNVTGNGWKVPIAHATASGVLPASSTNFGETACFTGSTNSTTSDCTATLGDDGAMVYVANSPLEAGEGLTIVTGIPLGMIQNIVVPTPLSSGSMSSNSHPSLSSSNVSFQEILPGLIFTFFFIGFFIFALLRFAIKLGRKRGAVPVIPKELKNVSIIAEYEPPKGMSPILVGTLLDRTVDMTDISSVIMDLAVRGYIKIRHTVKEIPFWPDKKDFELSKLKEGTDLVQPADKIIFELLFAGRSVVTLSELQTEKEGFQEAIKRLKKETEQVLYDEGYFSQEWKDAQKKKDQQFIVGFVVFGVLFVAYRMVADFVSPIFIGVLLIALVVGMALYTNRRKSGSMLTEKGLTALQKTLGFREFLRVTETDRMAMMQAPQSKPETFVKFLPYAMVLGVENEWAKKFEGLDMVAPSWYEDRTMTTFQSMSLMNSLGMFDSSFNQVFNITSPRNSSSSGFSGGFSGGGSGGGGGGSW